MAKKPVNIYDSPEYWCGDIGYRPPGYGDFDLNTAKEICIMIDKPQSVLDMGCAYGYTVWRLNLIGIPAKGIDISQLAISRASDEIRPKLVNAPLWDMPFNDKEFDYGFSSGVLEHIPQDKLEKTVSEIVRVCHRGLIGVAIDRPQGNDKEDESHCSWLSLKEWGSLFPKQFHIIPDSTIAWRTLAELNVYHVIYKRLP